MPVIFPYIPRTITVHLGAPDQAAENVTVSFPDYVKNVASSEIYPTWEPAAIRANVLAIVSFALNRVYTEFYPSRGYDFQITSTTAYDQKFIRGRGRLSAHQPGGGRIFRRLYPPGGLCRAAERKILQRHHHKMRWTVPVGQPGAGPGGL